MTNSIYSIQKLRELARRLDRENNHTPCHSENVADLAMDLCRGLGIRGRKKDMIVTACLIHDVGKLVLDSKVWAEKEKLDGSRSLKVKMHPAIAARLAMEAGCGEKVAEIIYYHHVWYNGSGYPEAYRRKGMRLPVGSRILSVCDAYESMVAKRAYKDGIPPEEAIGELRKNSVRQFDPRIVEIFIKVVGERDMGNGKRETENN